jgi:hypothetical protein
MSTTKSNEQESGMVLVGDPTGATADSARILRFPHEPQTLGRKLEQPKKAA